MNLDDGLQANEKETFKTKQRSVRRKKTQLGFVISHFNRKLHLPRITKISNPFTVSFFIMIVKLTLQLKELLNQNIIHLTHVDVVGVKTEAEI